MIEGSGRFENLESTVIKKECFMNAQGYYRYPTVFHKTVVFVSEGDLWEIPVEGGDARRLTSAQGKISHPHYSPKGQWIAFTATEEGHGEVYVMPAEGGRSRRLTYTGDMAHVIGWVDEETVLFASAFQSPFAHRIEIFKVPIAGGLPEKCSVGPATFIDFNKKGKGVVIQRHGSKEFGYWKRYKGGMAGQIWCDEKDTGNFKKIVDRRANYARPLWVEDRIYFSGDPEGHGHLYSIKPDGTDIKLEVALSNYYIRNQSTDGHSIVFHAGGDLYYFSPKEKAYHKIFIEYASAFTQRNRKFVPVQKYLQDYDVHPHGHHMTVTARGKLLAFPNFEGPVMPLGHDNVGRYRLSRWLHDGKRLVVVNDTDGEEKLEIFNVETQTLVGKMKNPDIGRVVDLITSPSGDEVILTNHKNEILHVNLKRWSVRVLDRSPYAMVGGMDWSPDGKWVAYGCSLSRHVSVIKMIHLKTGTIACVTKPLLWDRSPSFDPDGKYLYFVSHRQFDAVYDSLHFDLGFPLGTKPYAIMLQKDVKDPFTEATPALTGTEDDEKDESKKPSKKGAHKAPDMVVDLPDIQERCVALPLEPGHYESVHGLKGKILYSTSPLLGERGDCSHEDKGQTLHVYDFEQQKSTPLLHHIAHYDLSKDRHWLVYVDDEDHMRVIKAGEKPEEGEDLPLKRQGWIQGERLKVSIEPDHEWRQIYKEAWRLQRDHFWVEDMSQVDWDKVYRRYWRLVDRLGSREELNDVLWEMQGELGTSHAYVAGGDMKKAPSYTVGALGAEFHYDKRRKAYKITRIIKGDIWAKGQGSPLAHPGQGVQEGDYLLWVAGHPLTETKTPAQALLNLAGQEVSLKILDKTGKKEHFIRVKTLRSEYPARYREWVESNRAYVHEKTQGRIGYVHIPDMGPRGYGEFHRSFLSECDKEGLIVDVRFNGGGHVSPLILEKLARKPLGYDLSRWMGTVSYPEDCIPGPLVALTNEYAGSDGDMFSHAFKLLKLGPLVGQRTWGGVIGILHRYSLVDRGYTTQPEFSCWFKDIGWDLENNGAEPDLEVEIMPEHYAQGLDPQLDKGLSLILEQLRSNPVSVPDFSLKPNLKLPEF